MQANGAALIMQFVPSNPMPQYMHRPGQMIMYPCQMPMPFPAKCNAIGDEDFVIAGQREVESRGRRRINRQQAAILENAFNENVKPNRNTRQELAQVLGISPRNVQVGQYTSLSN
jgi:hypothetical protein